MVGLVGSVCCRVFANCSELLELRDLERNCRFDVCNMNNSDWACSALEQAAAECKELGICVDWRSLTNGICGM